MGSKSRARTARVIGSYLKKLPHKYQRDQREAAAASVSLAGVIIPTGEGGTS